MISAPCTNFRSTCGRVGLGGRRRRLVEQLLDLLDALALGRRRIGRRLERCELLVGRQLAALRDHERAHLDGFRLSSPRAAHYKKSKDDEGEQTKSWHVQFIEETKQVGCGRYR